VQHEVVEAEGGTSHNFEQAASIKAMPLPSPSGPERRPKKFDLPLSSEKVQRVLVRLSIAHDFAQAAKERPGVERGQDLDELTRGCLTEIDERVGTTTWHSHHVACTGVQPEAVDLEQIVPLQHLEDFRLAMAVQRRTVARRVDRLNGGESSSGRLGRDTNPQGEADLRNEDRFFIMGRVVKVERHRQISAEM
jgi:hypothetical protein